MPGPTSADVIHRVQLGSALPTAAGVGGRGVGGGEDGGGGGGPGSEKPGQVQLPIPAHPIAQRGILVAPGTFKVALEVDGTVVATRPFEVRSDPVAAVTLAQQQARAAVAIELTALLTKVQTLAAELTTRKAAATGDAATKIQALQTRLVGAAGGGRGRGGGGRGAGPQPVRQQLTAVFSGMTVSGAQTGTVNPPTGSRAMQLAAATLELAAIEREMKALK